MILEFLALTFGLHILLVNLAIGLSTVIPLMKRAGERGNKELILIARKLMKFYAATYGLGGVLGTAFTVFLLSFYPGFIGLAGNIAFVPFALSILLICLHFISIVIYWYGWDKLSPETHFLAGVAMMTSAILIPLGFRAIFGFLNAPIGLELQPKIHLDTLKALSNPTFLTLYPKSIFASYTLTFFLLSAVFAKKEISLKFAKYGLVTLSITALLGIAYAETLRTIAPYKFANALGFLFGIQAKYNVGWLFALKMLFVAIQFVAIVYFLKSKRAIFAEIAGVSASISVVAGELLNAFSQYPMLIANVSGIPANVATQLENILNMAKPNPLTTMNSLYAITLAFLIPLLACFAFLVYMIAKD